MDPYSLGRELMDISVSERHRELEAAVLAREARAFRRRSAAGRVHGLARHVNLLLCQLGHGRVVLAERLPRFGLAQSVLRGEQARLSFADRCDRVTVGLRVSEVDLESLN